MHGGTHHLYSILANVWPKTNNVKTIRQTQIEGHTTKLAYNLQKFFAFRNNDVAEKLLFILKDWILDFKKLL